MQIQRTADPERRSHLLKRSFGTYLFGRNMYEIVYWESAHSLLFTH
jgi:hypothetical protein